LCLIFFFISNIIISFIREIIMKMVSCAPSADLVAINCLSCEDQLV